MGVEFLELISIIRLNYFLNNIIIYVCVCNEVIISSQF
jgi:hypothetical protein